MTEHDYAEAARALDVKEEWLRLNIGNLPHYKKSLSKKGRGKVTFSDAHLDEIRELFEHRPAEKKTSRPLSRRRAS